MNTQHKHAALIKAWADGATIEHRYADGNWRVAENPGWWPSHSYRIQPKTHKWQKEMDAQAAGKTVQLRNVGSSDWMDGIWNFNADGAEYRIKPEQVEIHACLRWVNTLTTRVLGIETSVAYNHLNNLKLIFEEGKLVSAEVLK